MTGGAAGDEFDSQKAFLLSPVGAPGSGTARYAAAMHFYCENLMPAGMLEVYRRCSRFDRDDPLALARDEGVEIPALSLEVLPEGDG